MPHTDHIVKSFDEELDRLNRMIAQMGGMAEAQLGEAIEALQQRNTELASEVVKKDEQIDELERQIDARAVRLLALRQPMAGDLRAILSALKIAADLERIGDYAANIAKRALVLAQLPTVRPTLGIARLARVAQEILKQVLDAFAEKNVDKAIAAWARDEELDELYTSLFREVLTYMMEDPRNITPCTHLLFMAKNIERMGDHATNIAENIHFQIKGQPLTAVRPKGDTTGAGLIGVSVGKGRKTGGPKDR